MGKFNLDLINEDNMMDNFRRIENVSISDVLLKSNMTFVQIKDRSVQKGDALTFSHNLGFKPNSIIITYKTGPEVEVLHSESTKDRYAIKIIGDSGVLSLNLLIGRI